ncbi:MAG TPA: hypothetical protein PK609_01025 [Candidatus Paceibacterota bacterium]|nr:hypothetical protein [Candidatus Paceibacterota bacterium]
MQRLERWEAIQYKRGFGSNAKGLNAENRFYAAIKSAARHPSWFVSVRLATEFEDSNGIDAIVETEHGPVAIQIKASKTLLRQFQEENRSHEAVSIAITKRMTERDIQADTFALVAERLGLR